MNQLVSKTLLGLASISFIVFSSQSIMALVPNNVAVIVNSGSTNTIGYRIYVSPTGEVNYVYGKGSGKVKLSKRLTKKFFLDLKLGEPLSSLPVQQSCPKSVSFGTSTTLTLATQQSPDISCPGSPKTQHIRNDVTIIVNATKVVNVPKSEGTPLPPQNF